MAVENVGAVIGPLAFGYLILKGICVLLGIEFQWRKPKAPAKKGD